MPYQSKQPLIDALAQHHRDADFHSRRGTLDGRPIVVSPDEPQSCSLVVPRALYVEPTAAEKPAVDSFTDLVKLVDQALSTRRGSHYAEPNSRRLTHRYTATELWLLGGGGLAVADKEDVLTIRAAYRDVIAANPNTSRALIVLRLLLLYVSSRDSITIYTRDGQHNLISQPPARTGRVSRVYSTGEVLF